MTNLPERAPARDAQAGLDSPSALGHVASASRRRFVKGGAVASPLVLTLLSRPVFGFEQACMTPSRMISGNHSGFRGPTTCSGTSLAARAEEAGRTQGPKPTWFNNKFSIVFGTGNLYKSTTGNIQDKLGAVFLDSYAGNDNHSNSVARFAAHVIAAYLNVLEDKGGVADVLTIPQVVHMWNDVIAGGGYCPQTGMCWTATGVIGYLQNSGIVPPA